MKFYSDFKPFLRWWLIFCVILVSSFYTWHFEGFTKLYECDKSGMNMLICSIIFTIFYIQTIWCGKKTYTACKSINSKCTNNSTLNNVIKLEDIGWFFSDQCLSIGMIGTVIGFISMLDGFGSTDPSNTTYMKTLLANMSSGMSIALYTTLVGLICSILLKLQYFNLKHTFKEIKNES